MFDLCTILMSSVLIILLCLAQTPLEALCADFVIETNCGLTSTLSIINGDRLNTHPRLRKISNHEKDSDIHKG